MPARLSKKKYNEVLNIAKKTHKILEDKTKICITSEGELVKSKKNFLFLKYKFKL